MTDAEAVKKIMENLTKTIVEFREVDMKKKLEESQRVKDLIRKEIRYGIKIRMVNLGVVQN